MAYLSIAITIRFHYPGLCSANKLDRVDRAKRKKKPKNNNANYMNLCDADHVGAEQILIFVIWDFGSTQSCSLHENEAANVAILGFNPSAIPRMLGSCVDRSLPVSLRSAA
jgi:hypothetical protein